MKDETIIALAGMGTAVLATVATQSIIAAIQSRQQAEQHRHAEQLRLAEAARARQREVRECYVAALAELAIIQRWEGQKELPEEYHEHAQKLIEALARIAVLCPARFGALRDQQVAVATGWPDGLHSLLFQLHEAAVVDCAAATVQA